MLYETRPRAATGRQARKRRSPGPWTAATSSKVAPTAETTAERRGTVASRSEYIGSQSSHTPATAQIAAPKRARARRAARRSRSRKSAMPSAKSSAKRDEENDSETETAASETTTSADQCARVASATRKGISSEKTISTRKVQPWGS